MLLGGCGRGESADGSDPKLDAMVAEVLPRIERVTGMPSRAPIRSSGPTTRPIGRRLSEASPVNTARSGELASSRPSHRRERIGHGRSVIAR